MIYSQKYTFFLQLQVERHCSRREAIFFSNSFTLHSENSVCFETIFKSRIKPTLDNMSSPIASMTSLFLSNSFTGFNNDSEKKQCNFDK